jgi:hypothetical protein
MKKGSIMIRVWIAFEPQVFREALIKVLSTINTVEIVEDATLGVDVGVFRLSATGELQDFFLRNALPRTKLIVLSPHGERAFIRLPCSKTWSEVKPFSMNQLLVEITKN